MTQNDLSNDAQVIAKEINEYALKLGEMAWRLGRAGLGEMATAKQIYNYLSTQNFGFPGSIPPEMIINFMLRVNPNELS